MGRWSMKGRGAVVFAVVAAEVFRAAVVVASTSTGTVRGRCARQSPMLAGVLNSLSPSGLFAIPLARIRSGA